MEVDENFGLETTIIITPNIKKILINHPNPIDPPQLTLTALRTKNKITALIPQNPN